MCAEEIAAASRSTPNRLRNHTCHQPDGSLAGLRRKLPPAPCMASEVSIRTCESRGEEGRNQAARWLTPCDLARTLRNERVGREETGTVPRLPARTYCVRLPANGGWYATGIGRWGLKDGSGPVRDRVSSWGSQLRWPPFITPTPLKEFAPMRKMILSLAVLALVASPAFAGKYNKVVSVGEKAPGLRGHPRHHEVGRGHQPHPQRHQGSPSSFWSSWATTAPWSRRTKTGSSTSPTTTRARASRSSASASTTCDSDRLPAIKTYMKDKGSNYVYGYDESQADRQGLRRDQHPAVLRPRQGPDHPLHWAPWTTARTRARSSKTYLRDAVDAVLKGESRRGQRDPARGLRHQVLEVIRAEPSARLFDRDLPRRVNPRFPTSPRRRPIPPAAGLPLTTLRPTDPHLPPFVPATERLRLPTAARGSSHRERAVRSQSRAEMPVLPAGRAREPRAVARLARLRLRATG